MQSSSEDGSLCFNRGNRRKTKTGWFWLNSWQAEKHHRCYKELPASFFVWIYLMQKMGYILNLTFDSKVCTQTLHEVLTQGPN